MADRKRTEPDWQDLRVFLALARHGSLSAAARALSVTHATIGRRIRSLEASVGERLVERRPDGYVLTDAGTEALAVASDVEVAIRTLGRGGDEDAPRGLVRVTAPPALALGFLAKRLARLPGEFPGLDVELATDLRVVSLERHEADVAVRLGKPKDGDVVAALLASMGFGFYGTPEVCRKVEGGGEPEFIGFDEANSSLPEAAWLTSRFPRARVAFRANNHFAQAIAARAGAGLALLPHYIGRVDGDLRLIPQQGAPPPREAWLVTRRQNKALSVRAVGEFIARIFAEEWTLFEP